MDQYIVLVGDIKGSKKLKESERKAAQEKLKVALDELNKEGEGIISQYSITLGDEFQGVLKNADGLFDQIWHILAALNPVMIRFSVGIGTITTAIQKEHVLSMDGPAFHIARKGIGELKEGNSLFSINLEKGESPELQVINQSLHLISLQVQSWKSNRITLQHLLRKGMDYKKIPGEIDISERAFYKNKKAGSLDLVNSLFNNVQDYINNQLKE